MENWAIFTNIIAPLSVLGLVALFKMSLDHSQRLAKLEQHQQDQDQRWWPMLREEIRDLKEKLDEVLENLRRDNHGS